MALHNFIRRQFSKVDREFGQYNDETYIYPKAFEHHSSQHISQLDDINKEDEYVVDGGRAVEIEELHENIATHLMYDRFL